MKFHAIQVKRAPLSKKNHARKAEYLGLGWSSAPAESARDRCVEVLNLKAIAEDLKGMQVPAWPSWASLQASERYVRTAPAKKTGLDIPNTTLADDLFVHEVEERYASTAAFLASFAHPMTEGEGEGGGGGGEVDGVLAPNALRDSNMTQDQWLNVRDHVALHMARTPIVIRNIEEALRKWTEDVLPSNSDAFLEFIDDSDNPKILEAAKGLGEAVVKYRESSSSVQKDLLDNIVETMRSLMMHDAYQRTRLEIDKLHPGMAEHTHFVRFSGTWGAVSLPQSFVRIGDVMLTKSGDCRDIFIRHVKKTFPKMFADDEFAQKAADQVFKGFIVGPLSSEVFVCIGSCPRPLLTALSHWILHYRIYETVAAAHPIGDAIGKTRDDLMQFYDLLTQIMEPEHFASREASLPKLFTALPKPK